MIHREMRDSVALLRVEHGKVNAVDVEVAEVWISPDIHDTIRRYLQKTIGKSR